MTNLSADTVLEILNNLSGIIIVATEQRKIVFINKEGEKYFKCKLESIFEKSCSLIINQEFHETFCLFEEVTKTDEVLYKFNVNLLGEAFSVTAFKIRTNDNRILIVHNFRFVNDLVSMIRKIETERDILHTKFNNIVKILDKLNEAFLLVNSKDEVSLMNRYAETATGISKKQVLNKKFATFLNLLNLENGKNILPLLKAKDEISDLKGDFVDSQGNKHKILINAFYISSDEKNFDYLVNIRDVERIEGQLRLKSEGELIPGFIGKSKSILQIANTLQMVKNGDTTILIQGESGTGKEVIARGIHQIGARKDKPFVAVNCAAIPEQLMESELFGHEKGAFTGALAQKTGKFEFATQGTIFLDEIGEMPLHLQTKLLRVLQEKSFERVGGNKQIPTNARIIAATNKNLAEEVENGNFRRDLFFRLNVIPIKLPPLRERKEDIKLLIENFLPKLNKKYNKNIIGIEKQTMDFLLNYAWQGNVRELMNVLEYGVICCQENQLEQKYFQGILNSNETKTTNEKYSDLEREKILSTLEKNKGSISEAAKNLEMHRSTLWRKMQKYKI
ncbi:sigma 54-interacting transcriptional regulator [bacterium]|nr:sigma 54-interacting transcriptional regulator [bacterium]